MVRNVASHVAHVTVFLHTTTRALRLLESVLLDVSRGGKKKTARQVFILLIMFIFYLCFEVYYWFIKIVLKWPNQT